MKVDKYHLKSESDLATFEFVSVGTKGAIRKMIEFQPTENPDVFNLAFGDKDPVTGEMNDLAVSDNGDTEKVLATVVDAVYIFFDEHPTAYVYASGSTNARTRLYQMGIIRFYQQLLLDFYLYGQAGADFFPFVPGKDYDGFLAQRKTS